MESSPKRKRETNKSEGDIKEDTNRSVTSSPVEKIPSLDLPTDIGQSSLNSTITSLSESVISIDEVAPEDYEQFDDLTERASQYLREGETRTSLLEEISESVSESDPDNFQFVFRGGYNIRPIKENKTPINLKKIREEVLSAKKSLSDSNKKLRRTLNFDLNTDYFSEVDNSQSKMTGTKRNLPITFEVQAGQTDTVDLKTLYNTNLRYFEDWLRDDETSLINTVLAGAALSRKIKDARAQKYSTVSFRNFSICTGMAQDDISSTDLTKSRFFALLHRFLNEKIKAGIISADAVPVSPLISKITMGAGQPLDGLKYLMGAGFQFQLKANMTTEGFNLGDYLNHVTAAVAMDFISAKHPNYPNEQRRARVSGMSYQQYYESSAMFEGDVIVAMMRNAGDLQFSWINSAEKKTAMFDRLARVTVDLTATGAVNVARTAYARIQALK